MTAAINAFIPIKGHSERVPGKNMRPFAGRPLFHTIVLTLNEAASVGTVYIDTDSDLIAESATALPNTEVVRRRPDLIGDDVSVNRLIRAFLDDHPDEHLLQTHCTNPLLTAATIDAAVATYFASESATSLFTVTRIQARLYDRHLDPINHDPRELIPTQQLPPVYLENSNLYILERDAFMRGGTRITSSPTIFEMDPHEAVDIDEERDFLMAEIVYRGLDERLAGA